MLLVVDNETWFIVSSRFRLSATGQFCEGLGSNEPSLSPCPRRCRQNKMAAEIRENKCIVLQSRPGVDNEPTESNFALETREFPPCNEGQILVKTLYLSVDPYMRCRMNEDTAAGYLTPWQLGQPPSGGGVGMIVQSRSEKFQEGDVLESFQWQWQEFLVFSDEDPYLNKVLILAVVNTKYFYP